MFVLFLSQAICASEIAPPKLVWSDETTTTVPTTTSSGIVSTTTTSDCVWVNHFTVEHRIGKRTCECVPNDDPCFYDGECVLEPACEDPFNGFTLSCPTYWGWSEGSGCPGSGHCCVKSWSSDCDDKCAELECEIYGKWIPKDYHNHPFTCETQDHKWVGPWPNSYISGYNREHWTGNIDSCKLACYERSWCKSFDYYNGQHSCDLSDRSAFGPHKVPLETSGKYDHYELTRFNSDECAKVVMTDLKTTGMPSQTEDNRGNTVLHDVKWCRETEDETFTRQMKSVRTESVTNSYSNSQSWSETFSTKVGSSVEMKIEGAFIWGKASAAVKVDKSTTHTSTTGGSSTSTNVQTNIKSYEGSSTYTITVPAFTWKDITVKWQKFQVDQSYTATALCMDKNDKVIEKKTVSGRWKGAYLSQSQVSTEDRTDECPTSLKCECAGLVASYIRQGIKCSDRVTGEGQFCYVRKDAPCANMEQLDLLDAPVSASLFRKSGDPCVIPTSAPSPRPTTTPTTAPSPRPTTTPTKNDASCSANPGCSGLAGDCCPASSGMMLACCYSNAATGPQVLAGTYEVEECSLVEKSCTDIANCAGEVTCTGPTDSTCSHCEPGFSGDACLPNSASATSHHESMGQFGSLLDRLDTYLGSKGFRRQAQENEE